MVPFALAGLSCINPGRRSAPSRLAVG